MRWNPGPSGGQLLPERHQLQWRSWRAAEQWRRYVPVCRHLQHCGFCAASVAIGDLDGRDLSVERRESRPRPHSGPTPGTATCVGFVGAMSITPTSSHRSRSRATLPTVTAANSLAAWSTCDSESEPVKATERKEVRPRENGCRQRPAWCFSGVYSFFHSACFQDKDMLLTPEFDSSCYNCVQFWTDLEIGTLLDSLCSSRVGDIVT